MLPSASHREPLFDSLTLFPHIFLQQIAHLPLTILHLLQVRLYYLLQLCFFFALLQVFQLLAQSFLLELLLNWGVGSTQGFWLWSTLVIFVFRQVEDFSLSCWVFLDKKICWNLQYFDYFRRSRSRWHSSFTPWATSLFRTVPFLRFWFHVFGFVVLLDWCLHIFSFCLWLLLIFDRSNWLFNVALLYLDLFTARARLLQRRQFLTLLVACCSLSWLYLLLWADFWWFLLFLLLLALCFWCLCWQK